MADQYGSGMQGQMRRQDEYGNPIGGQNTTGEGMHMHGGGAAYGTTPNPTPTGGLGKEQTPGMHQHNQQSQLRRSGSSSSSSSEDDGQGGRRKKGIKEKIKEKLPGGQGQETAGQYQAGGGAGAYTTEEAAGGEKKGMMDKIKDKIPGMH